VRPLKLAFVLILLTCHRGYAGSATWKQHPHIPYWNQSLSWDPATVPNGPDDVATFAVSYRLNVSVTSDESVNGIVFAPDASVFDIIVYQDLTLTGAGITNDSGITQTFKPYPGASISFTNSATAGSLIAFTNEGLIQFLGNSNSGDSSFNSWSTTEFFDDATAANSTFVNNGGGTYYNPIYGIVHFFGSASAASGTFTNLAGINQDHGGLVEFYDNSTAGSGIFTSNGGSVTVSSGGISFFDSSTADAGTFTNQGGTVSGAVGSVTQFSGTSSAADSTIIAEGGIGASSGASIQFLDDSAGGTARVAIFGNGNLEISAHNLPGLTLGSIEGDGLVLIGSQNLTIGSNNLSTTFSGIISDTGQGSIVKTGSGNLTLTGTSTYRGGTTVEGGILLANNTRGSATGAASVQVNSGTFGGGGIVTGPVTFGTGSGAGAILAPGERGVTPGLFTIRRKLSLNSDATYFVLFDSSIPAADEMRAQGVTIRGAQIQFSDRSANTLPAGTIFTVIDNTSAGPISGTLVNLPEGGTITIGSNTFQASYKGGTGNDLTLTVVR
jgi:autotransporter-associated beta strand protein